MYLVLYFFCVVAQEAKNNKTTFLLNIDFKQVYLKFRNQSTMYLFEIYFEILNPNFSSNATEVHNVKISDVANLMQTLLNLIGEV